MTKAQRFFPGDRVTFYSGKAVRRGGYVKGTVVGDIFWGFDMWGEQSVDRKVLILQDDTETVHELGEGSLSYA